MKMKLLCTTPSLIFLKDKTKSMRVGIGMISRGEVGFIVAGWELHQELFQQISILLLL
jgi:hypothetical protein